MNKEQSKLFQRALRELVAPALVVDGSLGPASLEALRKYAVLMHFENPKDLQSGQAVDAVVRYINVRFITDEHFENCSKRLNVPQSYIRAVAEVESAQSGFLKDGRVAILFERHWFYKKLRAALISENVQKRVMSILKVSIDPNDTMDIRAVKLLGMVSARFSNVCSAVRGGYMGGEHEYSRLEIAERLDPESAYQAASYGRFQIMGFNCTLAGYNDAREMLLSYARGESEQLNSLASFVIADKRLHTALQKGDWANVARIYNGPAYKENNYDTRLATAQKKYTSYDK